ncbi:hypothetical protein JCM10207_000127 [Rhodosporidiobolus poonsookiae]
MGNSEGDTKPIAVPTAHLTTLPRPTPLPSDSHLRGTDNYDVWCIQMRGLHGADAWGIMTGNIQRPNGQGGIAWDKLNEFAVLSIIISGHASVIHHLRLLTRYRSLSLATASPKAFNTFAKEYKATLAWLKAAKVDLKTIYSSNLETIYSSSQPASKPSSSPWTTSRSFSSRSPPPPPPASPSGSPSAPSPATSTRRTRIEVATRPVHRHGRLARLFRAGVESASDASSEWSGFQEPEMHGETTMVGGGGEGEAEAEERVWAGREGGSMLLAGGGALPKSLSALRQAQRGEEKDEWSRRWSSASTGAGLREVDPRPPGSAYTTLAVTNQGTLSETDAILEVVRNEILRTSSSAPGVALLASAPKSDNPPPLPCPACKAMHWLRNCPKCEEYWLGAAATPGCRHRVPFVRTRREAGATHSMVGDVSLFADLHRCTPSPVGGLSGKNGLRVTGVGTVSIRLNTGRLVTLHNVLLVPGPPWAVELITWHRRFAHLSARSLKSHAASEHVTGLDATAASVDGHTCNVCHVSRLSRLPFPRLESETSSRLELVHLDILAIDVPSLRGRCYAVTFVNDYSRMLWVEPLARKSNVLAAFTHFKAIAENESGLRIQRFRSDNRGKYISNAFRDLLAKHGIFREPPPPYLPQSNGVAERVNRSIVERIIAFLSQSGAPKELWAEALLAFTFVKNRSPHAGIGGAVPLSLWRGRPARVDMLRVWGCRAWHTVTKGRSKLDNKAIPLIFVGYVGDMAAYRLYDPHSKCTLRSRNTCFVKNEFPFLASSSLHGSPSGVITPADLGLSPVCEAGAMPARHAQLSTPAAHAPAMPAAPARPRHEPIMPVTPPPHLDYTRAVAPSPTPPVLATPDSPDPINFLSDPFSQEVEGLLAAVANHLEAGDDTFALPSSNPRNHREAARDPHSERWREGEQGEFESFRDEYNVFHAVSRSTVPAGAKILGCRFVYRRKKDQHGRVTGHKVRLVVQGFSQRPGVDFRETFAPVAKLISIRVLLSLAAQHRLHVHQADVDKAYLHGSLDEELYMRIPEGINDPSLAGKVLKLNRALYGLKQAGCVWNHHIHASLVALGYSRTRSDACVYVRCNGAALHYIALYINDLLFVSPSTAKVDGIKGGLKTEYGIKDLGEANFILGIQVHRRADGSIFLSQRAYLEDVLLRLGQSGARTADTDDA